MCSSVQSVLRIGPKIVVFSCSLEPSLTPCTKIGSTQKLGVCCNLWPQRAWQFCTAWIHLSKISVDFIFIFLKQMKVDSLQDLWILQLAWHGKSRVTSAYVLLFLVWSNGNFTARIILHHLLPCNRVLQKQGYSVCRLFGLLCRSIMGGVPMGATLKDSDQMGEAQNNANKFHR